MVVKEGSDGRGNRESLKRLFWVKNAPNVVIFTRTFTPTYTHIYPQSYTVVINIFIHNRSLNKDLSLY